MRRISLLISQFVLSFVLSFVLPVAAQVAVSANHVDDSFGRPISAAKLCFAPVDATGTADGFRVGSVQVLPVPVCGLLAAGVMQPAQSLQPTPAGIYYHITVLATSGGTILRDYGMTQITGTSWTLDTYDPSTAVLPVTALSMGTVLTGSPGSSASCTISGSGPALLNCTIPAGAPGTGTIPGLSSNGTNGVNVTGSGAFGGACPASAPAGSVCSAGVSYTPILISVLPAHVNPGATAIVSDGTTLTDCTVGGGSNQVACQYNGVVWSAIGATTGVVETQVLTGVFTASSTGSKICAIESPPLTCTGGVGTTAVASTVQNYGLSSPTLGGSLTASVAHFTLTTENTGTSDVLWPSVVGSADNASIFKRESWFTMSDSAALYLGNVEADIYQSRATDSRLAMFGWQCNRFDTGYWQYANESSGWTNTPVPCNLTYGHTYHTILRVHDDPSGVTNCSGVACEYWDSFQLDDLTASTSTVYPLGYTMPTTATTWASTVGGQWQLDAEHVPSSSPITVGIYAQDIVTAYSLSITGTPITTYAGETTGELGEYDFDAGGTTGLTATGSPSITVTNPLTAPGSTLYTASSTYYTASITSTATLYTRAYVMLNAISTNTTQIMSLHNGSSELMNLYFNGSNQYLTVWNDVLAASTTCSTAAYPIGSYHYIEMYWHADASTGAITVKIDGVTTACAATGINTGTVNVTAVEFGQTGSGTPAWAIQMDNVGFSAITWLGAVNFISTNGQYDLAGSAASALAAAQANTIRTNTTAMQTLQGGLTASTVAAGTVKPTGSAGPTNANFGQLSSIPFGSLPLTGHSTLNCFGDSRTAGADASTTANRYCNQLGTLIGAGTVNNYGVNGSTQEEATVQVFNYYTPVNSSTILNSMASGVNNANSLGTGVPEVPFNLTWQAAAAFMSTTRSNIVEGGDISLPTNWSVDSTYSGIAGIQTTTNGASAVLPYTLTSPAQGLILLYGCINGDAGSFTVTDSVQPSVNPSVTTSPSSYLNELATAGTSSVCAYPITAPFIQRVVGSGSITVSMVSTSGSVHVYGVAIGNATISSTTPFVLAWDIYRMRNNIRSGSISTYNTDIRNNCSTLYTMGFNVGCVMTENYVFGTTTGSNPEYWTGALPQAIGCGTAGSPDNTGSSIHGCDTVQAELIAAAQAPFFVPDVKNGAPAYSPIAAPTISADQSFTLSALGTATASKNFGSAFSYMSGSYWNGSAAVPCSITENLGFFPGINQAPQVNFFSSCAGTPLFNLPPISINGGSGMSGNQGTGPLVQHSLGTVYLNELPVFDNSGNVIDSGLSINQKVTGIQQTNPIISLDASATNGSGGSAVTSIAVGPISVTAGDGITCEFSFPTATFVSLTDNVNSIAYSQVALTSNGWWNGIYYLPNAASGSTTITLTVSSAVSNLAMACQAWKSSNLGTFTLDARKVQGQSGTTANPTSGTAITPSGANELVIGNVAMWSGVTPTAGTNYTLANYSLFGAAEYWIQTTATATNAPYTMSANTWIENQAAFYFLSQALPNGTVATTQAAGDTSTKVATDAFVLNSTAHVVAKVSPTTYSGTAGIGATGFYTTTAAGLYRECGYLAIKTAPTAIANGFLVANWTSDSANVQQAYTGTITTTLLGSQVNGCVEFYADSGTTVYYTMTLGGVTGSPTFRYAVTLEQLQ